MSNHIHQSKLSIHYDELIAARLKMQGDLSHHLELICSCKGVDWINHSIATSIDLTWHALRDIPNPTILIIGGIDRAEDQHKLNQLVREKVHAVICLGSTPWKYFNAFRNSAKLIVRARSMEEAIHYASMLSVATAKSVLFSPSCPSYEAFDNYKNRGNLFKQLVKQHLQLVE